MIKSCVSSLTVLLVVLGTPAAQADSSTDEQPKVPLNAMTAEDPPATAVLPEDPEKAVRLSVDGAPDLKMGLPLRGDLTPQGVEADEQISYLSEDADVEVVATSTEGGFTVQTIIGDLSAPQRYTYPFKLKGGVSIALQPDGGALVLDALGDPVYEIRAPWALDADGRDVPTHYEVEGDNLIQVIEHRAGNYSYPITADPAVYFNPGILTDSYYISRQWTKRIANDVGRYANASNAAIALAFGAACFPMGGLGAVVCAGAGAVGGGFAIDQFLEAKKRKKCIRLRTGKNGTGVVGLYIDNSGYCFDN